MTTVERQTNVEFTAVCNGPPGLDASPLMETVTTAADVETLLSVDFKVLASAPTMVLVLVLCRVCAMCGKGQKEKLSDPRVAELLRMLSAPERQWTWQSPRANDATVVTQALDAVGMLRRAKVQREGTKELIERLVEVIKDWEKSHDTCSVSQVVEAMHAALTLFPSEKEAEPFAPELTETLRGVSKKLDMADAETVAATAVATAWAWELQALETEEFVPTVVMKAVARRMEALSATGSGCSGQVAAQTGLAVEVLATAGLMSDGVVQSVMASLADMAQVSVGKWTKADWTTKHLSQFLPLYATYAAKTTKLHKMLKTIEWRFLRGVNGQAQASTAADVLATASALQRARGLTAQGIIAAGAAFSKAADTEQLNPNALTLFLRNLGSHPKARELASELPLDRLLGNESFLTSVEKTMPLTGVASLVWSLARLESFRSSVFLLAEQRIRKGKLALDPMDTAHMIWAFGKACRVNEGFDDTGVLLGFVEDLSKAFAARIGVGATYYELRVALLGCSFAGMVHLPLVDAAEEASSKLEDREKGEDILKLTSQARLRVKSAAARVVS